MDATVAEGKGDKVQPEVEKGSSIVELRDENAPSSTSSKTQESPRWIDQNWEEQ